MQSVGYTLGFVYSLRFTAEEKKPSAKGSLQQLQILH